MQTITETVASRLAKAIAMSTVNADLRMWSMLRRASALRLNSGRTGNAATRMQLPVLLDRSRPDSLTNQLVEQLRDAIRRTMIAPGAKLPSSRRLAEQLDVSRNTVVRAYDILLMEGEIESRPASGMFVAMRPPEGSIQSPSIDIAQADGVSPGMPMPLHAARAQNLVHQNRARLSF